MTDDIIIREASGGDQDAIIRMMLGLNIFEDTLVGGRTTDEASAARHVDYIQKTVKSQNGCVLVAEVGGSVVGFLTAYEEEEPGFNMRPEVRKFGYVSDLYVDEAARTKGVAGKLITLAEKHFRSNGIKVVQIAAVAANHGALSLYEKLGYKPSFVCLEKGVE